MQNDEPSSVVDLPAPAAPPTDSGDAPTRAAPRRRTRAPRARADQAEAPAAEQPSATVPLPVEAATASPEPSAVPQPLTASAAVEATAPEAGSAASTEAPEGEQLRPGRRRRGRRGRRPEGADEGDQGQDGDLAEIADSTRPEVSELPQSAADTPAPAADAAEPASGATPSPVERRDGGELRPSGDGRDPRAFERGARPDGRGRREWREGGEPRDYRDGSTRHVPRERQVGGRERGGYQSGRDGRQNGSVPRDQVRDNYREAGYREPAGYRDGGYREAPPRERPADQQPAARPPEVLMRGYAVTTDQNQTQWQMRTHGHLPSAQDATIPLSVVRANGLRPGDELVGMVRAAAAGRRYGELLDVQSINGVPAERGRTRPRFDDLTPIYPDRHMRLERPDSVTARLIDLVCPIGFGQRALIVSPPKAGKTTILKEIGRSINQNYPDVKLIVCLVGERPEEVTDLAKSLSGEVISSTFDEAISYHTELAELTVERARRLVESGFDVVVLLDSITRLARAYNLAAPGDSRSLSGGMATSALYPPKRFFGAARAFQEGGSLTVIATCLIDTNSRLDDVIYEELKGTGNMELVLDRRLGEERIFPAVDIVKSSTRREELLLQPNELTAVLRLRRALSMASDPVNNTRAIIQQMERTRTNAEFLAYLLSQSSAR